MNKNKFNKNYIIKAFCLAFSLCLLLSFCGCQKVNQIYDKVFFDFLGTTVYVELNISEFSFNNSKKAENCFNKISTCLTEISNKFSTEKEDSLVYKYNQLQKGEFIEVDQTFKEVFLKAKEIYSLTGGAFNPAVKSLVDLWGFSKRHQQENYLPCYNYDRNRNADGSFPLPNEEYITAFSSLANFSLCQLEENRLIKNCDLVVVDNVSYLQQIDLSGVVKGYATDKIKGIIEECGYDSFYLSVGTSSMFLSKKTDNTPYTLGITDPQKVNGSPITTVSVENKFVSTSGYYQNYYRVNDLVYSHVINGETGYPVSDEIASVTVFCENGLLADGYTTAVMVMGREKGENFLKTEGVDYILITRDGQIVSN